MDGICESYNTTIGCIAAKMHGVIDLGVIADYSTGRALLIFPPALSINL